MRMPAHPHGHQLDERRPGAFAGTIGGPRECRRDRVRIGAIDRDAGDAVPDRLVGKHAHG